MLLFWIYFQPPEFALICRCIRYHVTTVLYESTDPAVQFRIDASWSLSRDLFNFWKISDNILKTIRDSVIVSIKFE